MRPSGERWAVPHDAGGAVTLVARGQVRHPPLRVLEATGGLERVAPAALAAAGLPVVVVTPRQGRDVARATGPLAKTDAGEARALAHGADVRRPTPRPLPVAQRQALRALLGRRQPLRVMRPAVPHRLAGPRARLQPALKAQSTWLNEPLGTLDADSETLLRARLRWRENDAVLQRAPGMGPVCARPLLRALPELGRLTRQQSAALGGVAPLHGGRGTLRGRRPRWGGRAPGRPVWSRGTLVATRSNPRSKAVDERLLAAGQVKKVALTACRPTFLTRRTALLQPRTPWHAQEGQG